MSPTSLVKRCAVTLALLSFVVWPVPSSRAAGSAGDGVQIHEVDGKLRVEIDGELFTEYYYRDVPRPYLYPVIGPGGLPMSRNWPTKTTPNESHDHPHHRSLWYAHGDINGHDFWSEESKAGKTIHEKFTEIKSGKTEGLIRSRNKWVSVEGTTVCTDDRAWRIYDRPNERVIDFEITIHASHGDLKFGDTKEGSMAIRLAESLNLKGKYSHDGHIVNSEGVRDGETWGKRAEWCDYYGPINGRTAGVAIFDHPQNPRHPTWWHVRDYGLFAANPFGVHDFEKKAPDTGSLSVAAGKDVTFKYRFYFHLGDTEQAKVAEHYREYAK